MKPLDYFNTLSLSPLYHHNGRHVQTEELILEGEIHIHECSISIKCDLLDTKTISETMQLFDKAMNETMRMYHDAREVKSK